MDEFKEIDSGKSWARLLQEIKSECANYEYTYKDAKKSENQNLNRYRDVSPYDHSRVKLKQGKCDYINASLVEVPAAKRAYILAQGPLPHTTGHFWQMVWEQNSKAVLMLNKVIEKNQVKCHQYWPLGSRNDDEDEMYFNDVGLKVEYLSEEDKSFFVIRQLKITSMETNESRIVQHFHYTTWPDFGVPESPATFLTFLLAVRSAGALEQNVGPPVVHCSAGIGRSGTFCLVDSCLVLIDESKDLNAISIKEILLEMRRYRMGLIQTSDQLRFSYLAIIEGGRHVLEGTFDEHLLEREEVNSNNIMNDSSSSSSCNSEHSTSTITKLLPPPQPQQHHHHLQQQQQQQDPPPPLPPRPNREKNDTNSLLSNIDNHVQSSSTSTASTTTPTVTSSFGSQDGRTSPENSEATETRRRVYREKQQQLSDRVESMRRKQKDSEAWQKRRCRRSLDHARKPYPERSTSKVQQRSSSLRPFQRQ